MNKTKVFGSISRKSLFLVVVILFFSNKVLKAQFHPTYYFDGQDSVCNQLYYNSEEVCWEMDTSSTNIWQIGRPQKVVFDSAATYPNALVTDTLNPYPPNNSSVFKLVVKVDPNAPFGAILAIQWKQKIDMDTGNDGGMIEFSYDGGQTWENAFNSPYVYNFYGFDPSNVHLLPNGQSGFSGQDTSWRDIWLCYNISWFMTVDSIIVRYTFTSDSIDNNRDGWMIDNLSVHYTLLHTINKDPSEQTKYLNVFPNPTEDKLNIEVKKMKEFHIIEKMELWDLEGNLVDVWQNIPTKFFIDTKRYANGLYRLKVRTNIKTETVPVIINHP